MFITLPLALIGVGLMIYLLFAAATHVLPLFAGLLALFGALSGGASLTSALLLGMLAFLLVITLGQMATQLLPSRYGRVAIALLFAVPAGIAGFHVASALLHISDAGSWSLVLALLAALATGAVAAKRHRAIPRA
jgi:hypothetical protein